MNKPAQSLKKSKTYIFSSLNISFVGFSIQINVGVLTSGKCLFFFYAILEALKGGKDSRGKKWLLLKTGKGRISDVVVDILGQALSPGMCVTLNT